MDNMVLTPFGVLLQDYRKKINMSRKALAFELTVSDTWIRKLEYGIKPVPAYFIYWIADAIFENGKGILQESRETIQEKLSEAEFMSKKSYTIVPKTEEERRKIIEFLRENLDFFSRI